MSRYLLPLFVVLLFAGCSESPKVREFKEAVSALVKEGRAGVKMLESGAKIEDIKKQSDKLKDLDAHVPDVPKELNANGELAKQIEDVSTSFSYVYSFASLHQEAKKYGNQETVVSTKASLDETVAEMKAALDKIEAKLGL